MRSVATLLLAQILLPQGTLVTGRVINQDAKPVAGAEVVLLHRQLACPVDIEPAHRVLAKSDAGGMFHANLHPHCRYSASARWAGAASRIEEGVEAGSFFELRQDLLAAPRKIAVFGLAPY